MSCILNAMVPKAVAHKKRLAFGNAMNSNQTSLKGRRTSDFNALTRSGLRGSCFQRATPLSNNTTKAVPCTTWTKISGVKLAKRELNTKLPNTAPTKSMVYIRATTRGRVSSLA